METDQMNRMTDKSINATVNEIQNTLESNGISMSFLDLDTLPDETNDFFDKKRRERMRPNLSRNDPEDDAVGATADTLVALGHIYSKSKPNP